ncbi:DsbA family protein [Chitinophaga pinensis]|uniref:Dithiol-disulfide isomerase n=1 Tax=Chitinophaga pinensis (strain ATCC 43595 / DSM 2588 / LMG 13176 / NBRC 15968 / NCIMB 11800 / UQM 2034) TaxID=485918 RepID=A0A979G411_CHIPD|nr:DsbA family protein [Chitinophaga pinensis]ACU60193.1 dithiol-disulfide isomerase [Chitinophaga pinensis DSM 2588]
MKLFYFTDPMCSWCYGFSTTVKKIKEEHPDVDLQIISGGFAPFSDQVVTDEYRKFLEYHWRNVNLRSGQQFDHAMKFVSDTFRYDTEPSSRALTVVQSLLPEKDFEYLRLLQQSFYVEGRDITNDGVLADLAEAIGIDKHTFSARFHSDEMKRKTLQGFEFSRQLGVQGFPTLLTLEKGAVKVICRGYQQYDALKGAIDQQLSMASEITSGVGQSCSGESCER